MKTQEASFQAAMVRKLGGEINQAIEEAKRLEPSQFDSYASYLKELKPKLSNVIELHKRINHFRVSRRVVTGREVVNG
jgi:hypothetical protein